MFPIKEDLCDVFLFTHIEMLNTTVKPTTEKVAFDTFVKVAKQQKDSARVFFGLSFSPEHLDADLKRSWDGNTMGSHYVMGVKQVFSEAGLSLLGCMGLEREVAVFTHEPKLFLVYQNLKSYVSTRPGSKLFLGLKLMDKGKDLVSKDRVAKDLFNYLRSMSVDLLVLVTHNVDDVSRPCTSMPVSSWSADVYQDPTRPALEEVFKFLEFGLMGEKEIEVALSSTLAVMTYEMKATVARPVMFGEPCIRRYLQSFNALCLEQVPNQQEHSDSLTSLAFNGTTLFSYETAATVEKKMRRFVMPLTDKLYRRVGWAFFDLALEVYNHTICKVKNAIPHNFPRLVPAKALLEENRQRNR